MTNVTYHHPSRREILTELDRRLDRVAAARTTLRSLADARETPAVTVGDALEALEHELLLAARETESARARIES